MLARSAPQPATRALRVPSAARARNSAQDPAAAAVHCTDVCCGLNLTTCTDAPQRAQSTGWGAPRRSSERTAPGKATSARLSRGSGRRSPGGQVRRDLLLPARYRPAGIDLELITG